MKAELPESEKYLYQRDSIGVQLILFSRSSATSSVTNRIRQLKQSVGAQDRQHGRWLTIYLFGSVHWKFVKKPNRGQFIKFNKKSI